MKSTLVFVSISVLLLVLVQVKAQDVKSSVCRDEFEVCSVNHDCCRNLFCRKSPVVNKRRCVKEQATDKQCARVGDICELDVQCCHNNDCFLGRCRQR